jgi:polyhydroxybutyrate depolymerase
LRFRASLRGFILVAPEGTVTPDGTSVEGKDVSGNQFWNATDACCDFAKTGVDDLSYLRKLITDMKLKYQVDRNKIYIISHSNGGFMANRLACEMGESFAGIANLAGGSFKDIKNCKKPVAIPYLHIHATNDPTITYESTTSYAAGPETVAQWVQRNGCGEAAINTRKMDYVFLIPGEDTTETSWKNCKSGKDVAFWTIRAHETAGHSPHVPFFNLNFTDDVLNFLFK